LIALGLTPGPLFGAVLEALYDEQLDNRITQREQALERMRRLVVDYQRRMTNDEGTPSDESFSGS